MTKHEPRFDQMLLPVQKFIEEADLLKDYPGTNLYSTGCPELDHYLSGGIGRKYGYEIVLIAGAPGHGKSTLALNFVLDPIAKGHTVGLMILEDHPADVLNRLRRMTDGAIDSARNVYFLPEQENGYTLDQALEAVENWFKFCDVVLLDHLEYLFKGAVGQSEKDKFTAQELFMRKLNTLMKRLKKTIILVQHANKAGYGEPGMGSVMGSSAFAQTASKVIWFGRNKEGATMLHLLKTRFGLYRHEPIQITMWNNPNMNIKAV